MSAPVRQTIPFKAGGSFKPHFAYVPAAGLAPADLSSVTITSQVRTPEGKLIATLTITKDLDNMGFTAEAVGGTASWPHGKFCLWDVKFVDDNGVYGTFYSETIELPLEEAVTQ